MCSLKPIALTDPKNIRSQQKISHGVNMVNELFLRIYSIYYKTPFVSIHSLEKFSFLLFTGMV